MTEIYLHIHVNLSRAWFTEQVELLRANRSRFVGGVVHSFDGSAKEAAAIVSLGLYIGLNGCSLKTPENLAVVRSTRCARLHSPGTNHARKVFTYRPSDI